MADVRIEAFIGAHNEQYLRRLEEARLATARFGRTQRTVASDSRQLQNVNRDISRQLRDQSRQLGALTLQWQSFRKAMMSAALRTAVAGFASLVSVVGSLAAALVEVTAAAGAASAALGVVAVSALGGLGQAAMVATLGLKNVWKALTLTGKPQETAFEKLTKSAQDFVVELKGLRKTYQEVQLIAQAGLFPGLLRAVKDIKPIIGDFKQVIFDTAQAMGYLAERVAVVAVTRRKDLKAFGEQNVVTFRRIGDAAINFGSALLTIERAAAPLINHVTGGLVKLSQATDKAFGKWRKGGELASFFDAARLAWDKLTAIIGNLGGAIAGVMKAAWPATKQMLGAVEKVTQKWSDWTNSVVGKNELGRYFAASNKVLGAMAKLVGAMVVDIAKLTETGSGNAVRFFDGIRTKVLPAIMDIASQLNDGLFPHLMTLGGSLIDLFRNMLPALKPVLDLTGRLAQAAATIASAASGIQAWASGAGKIGGLIAAIGIGTVLLSGWARLRLAVKLVVNELRQAVGLASNLSTTGQTFKYWLHNGRVGPVGGSGGTSGSGSGGGGGRGAPGSVGTLPVHLGAPGFIGPRGVPGGGERGWAPGSAGPGFGSNLNRTDVDRALAVSRDLQAGAGVVRVFRGAKLPQHGSLVGEGPLRQNQTRAGDAGLGYLRPGGAPGSTAQLRERMRSAQGFYYGRNSVPTYGYANGPGGGAFGGGFTSAFRDRMRVPLATFRRVVTGRRFVAPETSPAGRVGTVRPLRGAGVNPTTATTLSRGERMGMRGHELVTGLGQSVRAGFETGVQRAKPLLKAGIGGAALSGFISAAASWRTTKGAGGHLQDFLSGATFGALPSQATAQNERAAKYSQALKSGNFRPLIDRKATDGSANSGPRVNTGAATAQATALKRQAAEQKALNFYTDKGRDAILAKIEADRKGHRITDEVADSLKKQVRQMAALAQQTGLTGKQLKEASDKGYGGWTGPASAAVVTSLDAVQQAFDTLAADAGKSLKRIKTDTKVNASIIKSELGSKTDAGRAALSHNYALAAKVVHDKMAAAGKWTKDGVALMNHYLDKELTSWGLTKDQAKNYRKSKTGDTAGKGTGSTVGGGGGKGTATGDTFKQSPGAERGRLATVPGSGLTDRVAIPQLGAVVAPGEEVAVVNRHQRRYLDQRLAPEGGFAGVFRNINKRHSAPLSFERGGLVGLEAGSAGVNPAVTGLANQLVSKYGLSVTAYRNGQHAANSYHYKGMAADLGGPQASMDKAASDISRSPGIWRKLLEGIHNPGLSVKDGSKVGSGFWGAETWANHRNHIHLALGAAVKGLLGGGGTFKIPSLGAPWGDDVGDLFGGAMEVVRQGVQGRGQQLVDSFAAAGGGDTSGVDGVGGSAMQNMKLAQSLAAARGWTGAKWEALKNLGMGESGWITDRTNPDSGAFGIGQFLGATKAAYASKGATAVGNGRKQIEAMLSYISDRYGDPSSAYSTWLSRSPHWYSAGTASIAQPPIPGTGGTVPHVSAGDATGNLAPGHAKKEAAKKKKAAAAKKKARARAHKDLVNGPQLPGVAAKKRATKKKRPHTKAYWKALSKAGFFDGIERGDQHLLVKGLADHYTRTFDPSDMLDAANLRAQGFDLSDEDAVPTLYDSIEHADLSAYFATGTADAQQAKRYFDASGGDLGSGMQVLNRTGMNVQGVWTPGISQHVAEDDNLLFSHFGAINKYNGGKAWITQPKTGPLALLLNQYEHYKEGVLELKRTWQHQRRRKTLASRHYARLKARGGGSWQDRVQANNDQIAEYRKFLREQAASKVGKDGLTDEGKRRTAEARSRIGDLTDSNRVLRRDKPRASKKSIAAAMALESFNGSEASQIMTMIDGSDTTWTEADGGVSQWAELRDTMTSARNGWKETLKDLTTSLIPSEFLSIVGLQKDREAWAGSRLEVPSINSASGAISSDTTDALVKEQLANALQNLAGAEAWTSTLTGFEPLTMARMVGAFAHGGVIPQTGMALVHQNETIIPDPEGPYASRVAAAASAGGSGPSHVLVQVDGSIAPLLGMIRAEVKKGSPDAASSQLGIRSRLIGIAPGR